MCVTKRPTGTALVIYITLSDRINTHGPSYGLSLTCCCTLILTTPICTNSRIRPRCYGILTLVTYVTVTVTTITITTNI